MKDLDKFEKLEHVLQVFNKRILPAYFFMVDPDKFMHWQGNICKQAALLNIFVIKHFLGDEYKVKAYEGFFEHEKLGSYNHCWNYLEHESGDWGKNIICDFTSTITYMNYCDENDPSLHIMANDKAVVKSKIEMRGYESINIKDQLSQPEFYSGLTGDELEMILTNILKQMKLW